MPEKHDIALIGMAVMGQNLSLNIARHGYSVVVFNRTPSKTDDLIRRKSPKESIFPVYNLSDLVNSLKTPRKILLMVKAGPPIDEYITQLCSLLQTGDLIIDGGNSYFQDTERRERDAEKSGLFFLGTGISGGEEGALFGPSIMPGGHREGYEIVKDILLKAAAQTEDGPCCTYLGPGGAGHFVKMVHNGIEYALMEFIAEIYDMMRKIFRLNPPAIADFFEKLNDDENFNSYLLEITVKILRYRDPETGQFLIDFIDDKAEQKGTGKWTSKTSFDFGIPTPAINQAVVTRILSALKRNQLQPSTVYRTEDSFPSPHQLSKEVQSQFSEALYLANIVAFNEGFHLLAAASQEKNWNLPLSDIARIWKGGCILRTRLLNRIQSTFQDLNQELLIESPQFSSDIQKKIPSLRKVCILGIENQVPLPSLQSVLAFIDGWTASRLPTNLIQAQRDFFGAHTYRRIDREGIFHTQWEGKLP